MVDLVNGRRNSMVNLDLQAKSTVTPEAFLAFCHERMSWHKAVRSSMEFMSPDYVKNTCSAIGISPQDSIVLEAIKLHDKSKK